MRIENLLDTDYEEVSGYNADRAAGPGRAELVEF